MAVNVKARGNGSAEAQKEKAIELAVSSIEKQFGKGAILKMDGDAVNRELRCSETFEQALYNIQFRISSYK